MNKRKVGASYEKTAADYLENQGYKILDSNYRCRIGEIDLVAREDGYLVFVEVKYRADDSQGNALEAVDARKQATIRRVARHYLWNNNLSEDTACRFDVVGITGGYLSLVRDAF